MKSTPTAPRVGHDWRAMRIPGKPARLGLEYVLEFYINRIGGPKRSLDRFTAEEGSLDDAREQARSIMRNVKFEGAMANLCVIKTRTGAIVCEVKPDEGRP